MAAEGRRERRVDKSWTTVRRKAHAVCVRYVRIVRAGGGFNKHSGIGVKAAEQQ